MEIRQQRGLYFDELEEGVLYRHAPGRTITEADNVLFSTLSMNAASIHLDAHLSSQNEFGRPLVNSMLTLALLVGLSVQQMTQTTTIANLGFESVEFPKPLFAGDTIYASTTVIGLRRSKSRQDAGLAQFEHIARNQDDEIVAVARRVALMRCAPREGS